MKKSRFYQIGDIHFPDLKNNNRPFVDIKDKTLPGNIISRIGKKPFEEVSRFLIKDIESHLNIFKSIFLCGDLTSRGLLPEYEECVKYIKELLCFGSEGYISEKKIHVVPGNHDIDRSKYDPKTTTCDKKFAEIQNSWDKVGLPILSPTRFRLEELKAELVNIYSINSCWGCCEYRQYPEIVRDTIMIKVTEQFDKYIASGEIEKAYKLISEQLDSPLFDSEDLTALVENINDLPGTVLPIILSHHNLLPQSIPRLQIYSELLNAGFARSAFLSCKRPVIYLHGHIHKNTVEFIHDSKYESKLISIAAPELLDGYNILDIFYGEKLFPIGCQLTPVRFNKDIGLVQKDQNGILRIPFYFPSDAASKGSNKITEVLRYLPDPNKTYRWWEFVQNVRDGDGAVKNNSTSLQSLLVEVEWFGYIEIIDREEEFEFWKMKRVLL